MTITDILDQLNIAYDREGEGKTTAGWVEISCPWCGVGPDKRGLGLCLDGRKYCSCWNCGSHRVVDALIETTKLPFREIASLLGTLESESGYTPKEQLRGKLVLPKGVGPLLKAHKRYLKSRGFDPEELTQLWKLQGIGICSELSWRLFIPIQYQGQTVSWTTRKLNDDGLRYITAKPEQEKISSKQLLFGEDYARHSIIAVEGPFDVMRVGPGAGGTSGLEYSTTQVMKLSKYPTRIIVFDSSAAAQEVAKKLCYDLAPFPGKTMRVEIDAKDPGSASDKEIRLLRRMLR